MTIEINPITEPKRIKYNRQVAKEDIAVRFYEEAGGTVVWEALGEFQQTSVHKQVAITFRTPPYANPDIDRSVKVRAGKLQTRQFVNFAAF